MKWLRNGILVASVAVMALAVERTVSLGFTPTNWLVAALGVVLILIWHPIRNMRPPCERAWYVQALWLAFFHWGLDRDAAARRLTRKD